MLGRKTLKSERARMERIDARFQAMAQILLVLYAIFVLVSWLSYRPVFALTSVSVSGTHAIANSEVQKIAESALQTRLLYRIDRNNMLLYPTSKVLAQIKATYGRVKDVHLVFDNRHKISIVVEEYQPAMLYCLGFEHFKESTHVESGTDATTTEPIKPAVTDSQNLSTCYFADERGYIFSSAPNYAGYPFMAVVASSTLHTGTASPVGTYALDPETFHNIEGFITQLNTIGFTAHVVELLAEHDIRIKTDRSWDILWTTTKDKAESIKNLGLVLDSIKNDKKTEGKMSVIDLRFGNKIFFIIQVTEINSVFFIP